ncbi:hypothetical protein [Sandaracinus amylolyticus]|uniref:hypothetical protein n=1 Tax=Sandaracinus amylolyticus TaxID=927083 RepID=UPI001F2746F2|nr:hypothetical protein [Sandaracinus amylolyticus]UJR86269.1 Hypothetical protein I5071_83510 [Sandaracinus amylolyticus]
MRASIAAIVLGLASAACGGGGSGETARETPATSGAETARSASSPYASGPLPETVAANQQGERVASTGVLGEGASAPSEADVLGRSGYGGAGRGAGGGAGLIGADREHPVPTCGPQESYLFVARDFQCPGGQPNPLGGDPGAGAAARRGNVGPHAYSGPLTGDPLQDAHIVDVYEVPCPSGPVEVFVCMYHCAP